MWSICIWSPKDSCAPLGHSCWGKRRLECSPSVAIHDRESSPLEYTSIYLTDSHTKKTARNKIPFGKLNGCNSYISTEHFCFTFVPTSIPHTDREVNGITTNVTHGALQLQISSDCLIPPFPRSCHYRQTRVAFKTSPHVLAWVFRVSGP